MINNYLLIILAINYKETNIFLYYSVNEIIKMYGIKSYK